MRFLPANAQHIGARHSQQDSFGFSDPDDREFVAHAGFLAVVCDGMGGMEFGDAASRAATRAFLDAYRAKTAAESIPAALERSVRTANAAVVSLADSYGLPGGMGTTLVAAVFHDSSMDYISVGDSGLFLLRAGSLQMLNRPHVFARMLDAAVARGALSRADADNHPERESLTSFIGSESLEEIDASAAPIPLAPGDAVFLASDGLFKTLSNGEMVACLHGDPHSWPDALVAQTIAKQREQQDNVTVLSIAAEPDGVPAAVADPLQPVAFVAQPQPVPVVAVQPSAPSRSLTPIFLIAAILVLAVAGAGWYFTRHRDAFMTAHPRPSDPGSEVSAPPRTTPIEIKVDPDAPISHPPEKGVPR